jgi:hypothetical protein
MDMFLKGISNGDFVQKISLMPLNLEIFSVDQCQILQNMAKKKRVLGSTDSIKENLSNFKRFYCDLSLCWPPFEGIVSDYLFADINALSQAFNGLTLPEFLEVLHVGAENIAMGVSTNLDGYVKIYLCCAHLVKTIVKDVDLANYDDKRMLKVVLLLFFNTSSYSQCKEIWKLICTFVLGKYHLGAAIDRLCSIANVERFDMDVGADNETYVQINYNQNVLLKKKTLYGTDKHMLYLK